MEDLQEPINQRVKILVDTLEQGVQRRFALRIGVHTTTINEILGKRQNKPGFDMLHKVLLAYPLLRAEWLMMGEGEMFKPTPQDAQDAQAQKTLLYNAAELFPENLTAHEPPSPGLVRGDVVEIGGQLVPTYSSGNRKAQKPTPPALPGLDLLQTVADTAAVVKELREQLAALQERVDRG